MLRQLICRGTEPLIFLINYNFKDNCTEKNEIMNLVLNGSVSLWIL